MKLYHQLFEEAGNADGAGAGAGAGTGAGAGALPPVTDFRTFIDDKGNFTKPDWAGTDHESVGKKFTSLPALVKSYATLERMNSNGNKVALPGDTATEAEWNAFYEKLGRPADPDKYELSIPEEIKGMTLDENAMKEFRSTAFKNGLNGKQVKALTDFYFKSTKSAIDTVQAKLDERHSSAVADLEKDWGPKDGTKYKEQLALAEKGAAVAGLSPDVLKSNPELSNNPHFIRAMAKVAATVKEAPAANSRGNGGNDFGGDIQGQIRTIMNDAKHPYWVKGHPDHARAVAEMAALHAKLNPEPAKN